MAYKQKLGNWLLNKFAKDTLLILAMCLFSLFSVAQKEDNIWVSGSSFVNTSEFKIDTVINKYYIDSITTNWGIYSVNGNSNICDSVGNLLMSSDGMNIYDKTYHFMEGGKRLAPYYTYYKENGWSGYSQSSIMLPMGNGKYYVFAALASEEKKKQWENSGDPTLFNFDLLWYHIVDMIANEGKGKVVQSNTPLLENAYLSKTEMMAVRHANGRDWWLLKGKYRQIAFHTFLVTAKGIEDYGVQSFPRIAQDEDWDNNGQCVFSQDGSKFATVIGHRGTINLFDFDRCTGKLTNQQGINVPQLMAGEESDSLGLEYITTSGIAFSPNQKYLYVNSRFNIQQYELNNSNTSTAWYHVAKTDTTLNYFMEYSCMYLGPNERLYIGNWHGLGYSMSVINNPNEKGRNCNWCPRCLKFPLTYGASTPPCMPNYRLGVLKGSECDSLSPKPPIVPTFMVYPNPATTEIAVVYNNTENTLFTIYDMTGRAVLQTELSNKNNKVNIDISHLANSIYTYKQSIGARILFAGKFVIN